MHHLQATNIFHEIDATYAKTERRAHGQSNGQHRRYIYIYVYFEHDITVENIHILCLISIFTVFCARSDRIIFVRIRFLIIYKHRIDFSAREK